jgi:hypothetical protein
MNLQQFLSLFEKGSGEGSQSYGYEQLNEGKQKLQGSEQQWKTSENEKDRALKEKLARDRLMALLGKKDKGPSEGDKRRAMLAQESEGLYDTAEGLVNKISGEGAMGKIKAALARSPLSGIAGQFSDDIRNLSSAETGAAANSAYVKSGAAVTPREFDIQKQIATPGMFSSPDEARRKLQDARKRTKNYLNMPVLDPAEEAQKAARFKMLGDEFAGE